MMSHVWHARLRQVQAAPSSSSAATGSGGGGATVEGAEDARGGDAPQRTQRALSGVLWRGCTAEAQRALGGGSAGSGGERPV